MINLENGLGKVNADYGNIAHDEYLIGVGTYHLDRLSYESQKGWEVFITSEH